MTTTLQFYLKIKDKRRILAKKSKEDKLKKPIAGFLEPKHILIFGRPIWFTYKDPNKLEKIAK